MGGVGFLTFGFTESVCKKPADRFHGGAIGPQFIGNSSVTIHGYNYNFSKFNHPKTNTMFSGTSNPVFDGGWNLGGNDASFLFQKVNQRCLGLITKASSSSITGSGALLDWYFPCNVFSQTGAGGPNITGYEQNTNCHSTSTAKTQFSNFASEGQVYFSWDDVASTKRNLAVFESYVIYFFTFPAGLTVLPLDLCLI